MSPLLATPPTLFTGEPAGPALPWWFWPACVGALAVGGLLVRELRRDRRPAGTRATDKLATTLRLDVRTRRAVERLASELELKSGAGLLISPSALASAIERGSPGERDAKRLRELLARMSAFTGTRE
ncbi:MAG: hypothetical protein ACF8Q5_08910 [Phycisphaerales bacterium JB040]